MESEEKKEVNIEREERRDRLSNTYARTRNTFQLRLWTLLLPRLYRDLQH